MKKIVVRVVLAALLVPERSIPPPSLLHFQAHSSIGKDLTALQCVIGRRHGWDVRSGFLWRGPENCVAQAAQDIFFPEQPYNCANGGPQ
jgi:hypothetical protein